MLDFNPKTIEPNYKNIGRDQKRICREMAKNNWIIKIVMDHKYNQEAIWLEDEIGDNRLRKLESCFVESLGKRGLFLSNLSTPSLEISIAELRLKPEVKEHFNV